jgi:hypothetical protein
VQAHPVGPTTDPAESPPDIAGTPDGTDGERVSLGGPS